MDTEPILQATRDRINLEVSPSPRSESFMTLSGRVDERVGQIDGRERRETRVDTSRDVSEER